MFTALNDKNTFGYPFEKIRNAIAVPSEKNVDAATSSGLEVLSRRYDAFRQELDAPVSWETGNTISIPTITVLRCCNVTSPAIHPGSQNVMPGFTAITCRLSTKAL